LDQPFLRIDNINIIELPVINFYYYVLQMRHKNSDIIIAVKRIRATLNTQEQKRLLMDLDVAMRSVDCDYTVSIHVVFSILKQWAFVKQSSATFRVMENCAKICEYLQVW